MMNWILTLLLLTSCGASQEETSTVKIFISSDKRRMHTEGKRYFSRVPISTGFISASAHSHILIRHGDQTTKADHKIEISDPGKYEVEYIETSGKNHITTKRSFVILENNK